MGLSSSTNSVNSMISNAIDVTTTYENICSSGTGAAETVFNVNGCGISGTVINVGSDLVISQTCITNASTQASIEEGIKQSINQSAQSLTQQFSFGTLALSQNFINKTTVLAEAITSAYINNCINQGLNSSAKFTCTNSTFNNSVINIDSFASITQNCVLNSTEVIRARQEVIDALDQSAVATQQNTFGYLLIGFAIILGIFAYAGLSLAQSQLIQWLIVFVILFFVLSAIAYIITARTRNAYPYQNT
jgi:hypothetical protein